MKSHMNSVQMTPNDGPPWFVKGMLCLFVLLCAIAVIVGLYRGNAKIKGLVGVKFGKKTPEQRDIGGIEGFRPPMVFVTPKSRKVYKIILESDSNDYGAASVAAGRAIYLIEHITGIKPQTKEDGKYSYRKEGRYQRTTTFDDPRSSRIIQIRVWQTCKKKFKLDSNRNSYNNISYNNIDDILYDYSEECGAEIVAWDCELYKKADAEKFEVAVSNAR